MGQDKFRRKSGGAKATQYDPRGSTAIVYFNTVQCSPKFMAIIVASTNIAVPYRYLDTGAASHSHGHAWHVCPVYIAILYSHGHHQLESSLRRLNFVLDQIIRRCRAPKWWLSFVAWQLATQDWPHIDFFFLSCFSRRQEHCDSRNNVQIMFLGSRFLAKGPLPVDRALKKC